MKTGHSSVFDLLRRMLCWNIFNTSLSLSPSQFTKNEGSLFSVVLGPSLCWRREPTTTDLELWRHISFIILWIFPGPFSAFALRIKTQAAQIMVMLCRVSQHLRASLSWTQKTNLEHRFMLKKCYIRDTISVGFVFLVWTICCCRLRIFGEWQVILLGQGKFR